MDMSSTMAMPSSTGMTMPMSSSHSHTNSMNGSMGGSMGGMHMSMQDMAMVFFTSTITPLYSSSWTPNSTSTYAGTCIFLIILSLILRMLYAAKSLLELKWRHESLQRRYIKLADSTNPEGAVRKDSGKEESTTAVLTTNGVDEKVRLVQSDSPLLGNSWTRPWRLSVDLPRALLVTVMVGVGYLL